MEYEKWLLDRLGGTTRLAYEEGIDPFYLETTGVIGHYKDAAKSLAKKNKVIIEHRWDKRRQRGSFREGDRVRLAKAGETYEAHFRQQKDAAE